MRLAIQAARRLYASRAAAWTVAGVAVMTALAAILLPGGRGTVAPYAASFNGLLAPMMPAERTVTASPNRPEARALRAAQQRCREARGGCLRR